MSIEKKWQIDSYFKTKFKIINEYQYSKNF